MTKTQRNVGSEFVVTGGVLLLLCTIAYSPMINGLGFYWDDWPSIWFFHNWGADVFREGFSSDRPLLAWIFQMTTPLFRESMTSWQYFGIFTRWVTALAWWWGLKGLWPHRSRPAFFAAALFAVYPGFGQQYISVTFSNAFIMFFLFIVSIGAMIWAQRIKRFFWLLMGISLLASAFSTITTEYFFGLELIRPFILWSIYQKEEKSSQGQIKSVLTNWVPYLFILLPYVFWRAFFTTSPRAQIILFSEMAKTPFVTIYQLVKTVLVDFLEVNFFAWVHDINPGYLADFDSHVIALLGAAIAFCLGISFLFSQALDRSIFDESHSPEKGSHSWQASAIGLGIAAFFLSGWTIWVTDLHFELLFPYDRFTIITMLGTSLLVAGLIGLLERRTWLSSLVFALLIGLSAGIQFQHRLQYRQEWLSQKNFFWQLFWRAPAIKPGTVMMTSEIPFTFFSDNSLTAPLNWIYAPQNTSRKMDYLLLDIEARLGKDLPEMKPGLPIDVPYRAASFSGSTSQAVVFFYDPPRCLKVMEPALDRFLPVKPLYIREAAPLSNPDLILNSSNQLAGLPDEIFGPEPKPNWCYYFEKAELYAQQGSWDRVVRMADEALKINKHFTEKNVSELIPFVLGYGHTGDWKKAVELTDQAYHIWDKTQYPLCDAWQTLKDNPSDKSEKWGAVEQVKKILSCTFY